MKNYKFIMVFIFMLVTSISFAANMLESKLATDETSMQLKKDLYDGRLKIGKARLKDIVNAYGGAQSVSNDDRSVTLSYGDLTVQFKKMQKWKKWEYDSFKQQVFRDNVDDLRFDLESQELVGQNITYDRIAKDYGEPTESMPAMEDGKFSIYYWGDIKMTFENQYVLQKWRSQKIEDKGDAEILTSTSKVSNVKKEAPDVKKEEAPK